MRIGPLLGALAVLWLLGCQSATPLDPGPVAPVDGGGPLNPDTLERDLQASTPIDITLNGTVTTDPGYQNSPHKVTLAANAGEISLVALRATALPSASNTVLARFLGTSVYYGALTYPTTGATVYLPTYVTATEPLSVELINSATRTGTLYEQAVRWQGSFKTVLAEDAAEPNDDEDPATYTDRTMGWYLPDGATLNRSVYQRAAGSLQDQEEWFRLILNANTTYRLEFSNSNGTWGTWRYDLRLLNSAGNVVLTKGNVTGTTALLQPRTSVRQTYHLQIVATPLTRRGSSVYYGAYSLKKTIVPAPTVTAVAPEGTAGVHLGEATFTATATENPTGWNWDFGGGATPNTSTAAAPTVTLGSPGTYTGTVTASNANGTSAAFPFSYAVATEPSWTRYNLSNVKAPQLTTAVIDGRPAFAYHPSEAASGGYWYATAADPTAAAQWVHSAVPDTTAGYPQALIDYNGLPVVAYYSSAGGDHQLRMLLGQTASPTTAAHWSSHTLYDPAGSGVEAGVTVHNGLLAVLYSGADAADDGLLVARTSIATPTAASDWAIHRAVVGGGTQGPVDLDVVNGRLAGTYMVATEEIADSVGYLRATADDPTEASHWAGHEIARANIPAGAKLLVAGGLPIVAFTKANGVIGIGENPGLYIARTATATPSGAEDWTYHRLAAGGITDRWDWDACLQGGRLTYASTDPANNLIRIFRALTTEPSGAADYRTITQFNASQTWSAVGVSAGGGSGTVVTHQPTQLTQVGETNLAW